MLLLCSGAMGLRADPVDDIVKAQLGAQKIPGAAVAVVKAGRLEKVGAYGMADTERKVPVTADTVFRIASVSKQFTAVGVMMLVETGKIGLEDPIARHLDGCPEAWSKITVRHLLAQTSGLQDFINEPVTDLKADVTDAQLLAAVAKRPLKFPP
ncbi:MAG: serine hydrolase domain-containing protein, partial [Verrucomicrobiota bacterium]